MRKKVMVLLVLLLALSWYQVINSVISVPLEYEAHIKAAEEYAGKEIYEDALTEYEAALLLKPENEELKLLIAEMELNLENKTAFIADCKELIYANPMNENALCRLTEYYAADGKCNEIVALLKELKKEQPENETVAKLWEQYDGSYEELSYSYQQVSPFYYGYAIVQNEESVCMIRTDGKKVLNGEYEEIGYFSEEEKWAAVKADGTWYYITQEEHKKLVPDEAYDEMGMVSEGIMRVSKNGKYSFIDKELNVYGEFIWDAASNMYGNTAAVCKEGKWALIDKTFALKTDYVYENIAIDEYGFCSRQNRIFAQKGKGYYMLNSSGEAVSEQVYEDARPFMDDELTAVCIDGKWGFVNLEGELVISCQYEDAKPFSNGYAPIKQDGKWGYIDESGNKVIEPCFADAYPFNEDGTAFVKDENWYLIKLYAISE